MPPTLWYDSDEVAEFHPHVEDVLRRSIRDLGLDGELEIIHHPTIVGSSTIPDFAVWLRPRGKYIFVLEVKRTKSAVESERFWIQTQGYISALTHEWLSGPRYFGITNLEELVVFAERGQHVTKAILKGGQSRHGDFVRGDAVALENTKSDLALKLKEWILSAYRQEAPQYAETWPLLVDAFYSTYQDVYSGVVIPDRLKKRDASLYELLRLLFFYYLKSSYTLNGHPNSSVFRALDHHTGSPEVFLRSLLNNFRRVLTIDFQQIFQEYPNAGLLSGSVLPGMVDALENFISSLEANIDQAYQENRVPETFFKLLADKIYEREQLHAEGKIMSDPELARLLVELTVSNKDAQVMDPGSGDGALLDAAYEKIDALHRLTGSTHSHNELLKQLHGCEIDSFLSQMAAFRLLSKNLDSVDNSTEIDLVNGDVFANPRPGEFDAVIMNPPFLRNDDPNYPISPPRKQAMLDALRTVNGGLTFVEAAAQPNLYFYFLDWARHYLKTGGRAGVILMAKFMGNKDGEYLKREILGEADAVISYPNSYFREFRVTTCILVLEKGNQSSHVNFLNIKKEGLLEDPEKIKNILAGGEVVTAEYSLKKVPRNLLDPQSNWRIYLLDPQEHYSKIQAAGILKELEGGLFTSIKRGEADNAGESKTLFLKDSSPFASFFADIEEEFIGPGMQNNRIQRKVMLTDADIEAEKGIHFPNDYETLAQDQAFLGTGLGKLFLEGQAKCGPEKWEKIVDFAYRSQVKPQLLLPRASREKYKIHIADGNKAILLSTNFCYGDGLLCRNVEPGKGLKVIAAYLVSSFGQVQAEIEGSNQEGLLKVETFVAKKLKSLDPDSLEPGEVNDLESALADFDALDVVVKGDEGIHTPRRGLDMAVAKVLMAHSPLDFRTPEELTDFTELFLEDLVKERSNQDA